MPKTRQILVIGAGMAGLAAARDLMRAGLQVTVLEARARLGGRILTDTSWGFPLDLGAAWIHGVCGPHPIAELAEQAVSGRKALNPLALRVFRAAGQEVSWDEIVSAFQAASHPASAAPKPPSALDAWVRATQTLRWGVAPEALLPGTEIGETGEDQLLLRGHGPLIDLLAQGLDLRTEQTVRRITLMADRVLVQTQRASFLADRVLVTVPLGVLKAALFERQIVFSPPLPETKQRAIERLGVGLCNKVALRFARPFWPPTSELLGCATPGSAVQVFHNLLPALGQPVLVAHLAGAEAWRLEALPESELMAQVMAVLRDLFGTHTPSPQAALITRWGNDPQARGALSYLARETLKDDPQALREPVADRLFFAGEATAEVHRGTTLGAYLSGLREASRIRALLEQVRGHW